MIFLLLLILNITPYVQKAGEEIIFEITVPSHPDNRTLTVNYYFGYEVIQLTEISPTVFIFKASGHPGHFQAQATLIREENGKEKEYVETKDFWVVR